MCVLSTVRHKKINLRHISDKMTDKRLLLPRDLTLSHRLAAMFFPFYGRVVRGLMTNTDGGQIN